MSLTVERLRAVLGFEPNSGRFTWIAGRSVGREAGCITRYGYLQIKIDQRVYFAHRLAWLYCNGKMPSQHIDHVDGDKLNNAIANLRECDSSENSANTCRLDRNTSGYKGVYRNGECATWVARIQFRYKHRFLGCYESAESAARAYDKAAIELFGKFAKTNRAMGLLA